MHHKSDGWLVTGEELLKDFRVPGRKRRSDALNLFRSSFTRYQATTCIIHYRCIQPQSVFRIGIILETDPIRSYRTICVTTI